MPQQYYVYILGGTHELLKYSALMATSSRLVVKLRHYQVSMDVKLVWSLSEDITISHSVQVYTLTPTSHFQSTPNFQVKFVEFPHNKRLGDIPIICNMRINELTMLLIVFIRESKYVYRC